MSINVNNDFIKSLNLNLPLTATNFGELYNTNIATKVGQIIDQYNDYVEKYNAFVEEIKKGYSDKSNERALEAETAFNEIEKIVRSFL